MSGLKIYLKMICCLKSKMECIIFCFVTYMQYTLYNVKETQLDMHNIADVRMALSINSWYYHPIIQAWRHWKWVGSYTLYAYIGPRSRETSSITYFNIVSKKLLHVYFICVVRLLKNTLFYTKSFHWWIFQLFFWKHMENSHTRYWWCIRNVTYINLKFYLEIRRF